MRRSLPHLTSLAPLPQSMAVRLVNVQLLRQPCWLSALFALASAVSAQSTTEGSGRGLHCSLMTWPVLGHHPRPLTLLSQGPAAPAAWPAGQTGPQARPA